MRIGDFHPALINYPIVLLTIVVALDFVRVFSTKRFDRFALWMLVFSVLALIPVIVTGFYAEASYPKTSEVLIEHRYLGMITGIYSLLHLILRIYVLKKGNLLWIKWLLLFSLINFLLIAITSDQGGLLVLSKIPLKHL